MSVDYIDFTDGALPIDIVEIEMASKMTDSELYIELTKSEKDEIYDLQHLLAEQKFGKGLDFPMKVCWDEAVRRLRKKWKK